MELRALLETRGIRNAVVIDDIFDDIPRPEDLSETDWTVFFDDLGEEGHKLLAEKYEGYESSSPDLLRTSLNFIQIVWENREILPVSACEPLFNDFEASRATERTNLDKLVTELQGLGLTCTTMGRDIKEEAKKADLIFIDLFLGTKQSDDDMRSAITRISGLVSDRFQNPPLVVLMSSSTRLREKRNEFRDEAGLLGSVFRVISKSELNVDGSVESLLIRLARHYEDSKRVASFVYAWDTGLETARKNFIKLLRKLDLSDLAQIRVLLLDFEGQRLGDYLLDVADRVLQHEIEAQAGTIAAVQELNSIQLDKYPPPHLTGSPDLQELVQRMIFQHIERLKLSFEGNSPLIQLGDLLQYRNNTNEDFTDKVLLIVTPACDLARCGIDDVLVVPGTLKSFSAGDWSYKAITTKTPIFIADNGTRYWIKWDLKGRHTLPMKILLESLRSENNYKRIGRIREMYAIEIQQKLLAEMGRVGQVANPPATFPVSISLYALSTTRQFKSVEVNGLDIAVCFVGRDEKSGRIDHLVLGEEACDRLKRAVLEYSVEEIHEQVRGSLLSLKANIDFFERFERGLILVPQNDTNVQSERGNNNEIYFNVVRNKVIEEGEGAGPGLRNAPFILKISDIPPLMEEKNEVQVA